MANTPNVQQDMISTEPIRLRWSEKDLTVLVVPEDNDLFTMQVQEVIHACHAQQESKSFESQYINLKNILGKWVHDHKDKLVRAFLTVRDTRILFLVITKAEEYDGAFEDELTALDWDVSNSPLLSLIRLSVQSLPPCGDDACAAFLSPGIVLEYVG